MEQVEAEVVWGVRASLHDPIHGLVGLSCPTTPDLRLFPDRERLTSFLLRGRQHEPARQIRQRAMQLWAFAREAQPGDLLVGIDPSRERFHLGEITGDYFCIGGPGRRPSHQREIDWLGGPFTIRSLAPDLAHALMSLPLVQRIRSERAGWRFRAMIHSGRTVRVAVPLSRAIAVETRIADFAEAGREAIRAMLRTRYWGRQCEELVAAMLEAEGYHVLSVGAGPDGGLDLIAGSGPLGFGADRLAVQVKAGHKPVSGVDLAAFEASMRRSGAITGLVVSLCGFTGLNARATARGGFHIRLWDEEALLDAILRVYEKMPDTIRRDLPLKRVWVPACL